MSVQGQSRRFDLLPVASGLPRTTDINRPPFGPVRAIRYPMVCPPASALPPIADRRDADSPGGGLLAVRGGLYATSYPSETREQTRTNVNELDRGSLTLLDFSRQGPALITVWFLVRVQAGPPMKSDAYRFYSFYGHQKFPHNLERPPRK